MAASSCKSVAPLRQSDFSIEHILTRAGERYSKRRKLSNEVGGCRNCCSTNSSSSSSNSSPRSVRSEEGEGDDNDNGGRLRDEPGTEADEELDEEIDVGQSVMQHPGQEAGFLPTAPSCGMPTFDWLYYTRYHPPKLPRPQKTGPVKRTPGRLPRVPFTPAQLSALEDAYKVSTYLSSEEANQLAYSLELTNTRVKIWFQNRRARDRREKREASLITGGAASTFTSESHPTHCTLLPPLYATVGSAASGSRTGSHPSSPSSVEASAGGRQSRSPTTDRSY
uniref:Homeobox domain-containing protein n=1 Tax=Anopheles coluzzii TaxID=1518534 RepID=A0A6E8VG68_ANOCL|nr:homeobox protein engrailed-2b [Anopheles coluzzii]